MRIPVMFLTALLLLLTSACNLSAETEKMTLESTPIAQEPTQTPFPTLTVRDTATPAPTTSPAPTTCSPRTDWISYSVVSGDTLGSLARRTNSTISQLAAANCLDDPDRLRTGQRLYLPRVPVAEDPPTVSPTDESTTTADPVEVAPVLRFDGDVAVVPATWPLKITLPDVPTDTYRVRFYVVPSDPTAGRRYMGSARADGDTPLILWNAPTAGNSVSFVAEAQTQDDTLLAQTEARVVRAESAGYDSAGAEIDQIISGDAGNVTLLRGATATLRYTNPPPGTTRVEFILYDDEDGDEQVIALDNNPQDGYRQRWTIPPNLEARYTAYAYAGDSLRAVSPTLNVFSGPSPGQGCVVQINTATNYYDEPTTDNAVGSAAVNETYEVLGRSLNGWYAINPDGSGSGAGGVDSLAWLPADGDYTENDRCN